MGGNDEQGTKTCKTTADFTVSELKEIARSINVTSTGTKAELLTRLEAADPQGTWRFNDELESSLQEIQQQGDVITKEGTPQIRMANREAEVVAREMELMRRERELLQREREILDRERAELQRERENREIAPRHREGSTVSVTKIAELLSTFDGEEGSFERWVEQAKMLRETYRLDDNNMKILIGTRLKGRALEWFHSRPIFLALDCDGLFEEIRKTFGRRHNRLSARRKFEGREWEKGESFGDYYQDKIILANRVPIAEDEVMDYVIEGIPNDNLRDHARLQCFKEVDELLDAFERISLKEGSRGKSTKGNEKKPEINERRPASSTSNSSASVNSKGEHCYTCGKKGHRAKVCPDKERGTKCFKCSDFGHIARDCKKKIETTKEANAVRTDDDDSIQRRTRKCKSEIYIRGNKISALLDSGSDLSLMRERVYDDLGRPRIKKNKAKFTGVGAKENTALGSYEENINIDGQTFSITIFVVPDYIIGHDVLIGFDLLGRDDIIFTTKSGRATVYRTTRDDYREIPESYSIEAKRDESDLDLGHVRDINTRETLARAIAEYPRQNPKSAGITLRVIMKDDQPIYERARRLSEDDRRAVRAQVDEWLSQGFIRESKSEYASPIVPVRKKNGDLRLCIDFRRLNKNVLCDRFPTPLIDETLDKLSNARVFCTLDLKDSYFHVEVEPDSQKYLAFITPDGHYEFRRAPFGYRNSAPAFGRFIMCVFRDEIREEIMAIYVDDIIVFGQNAREVLERILKVLKKASEFGIRINWRKCEWLKTRVKFLGHIVEGGTIMPSREKVEAIQSFPMPKSVTQVQSFLGLSGYFRKFVNSYSTIARPLTDLLRAETRFRFGESERRSFDALKNALCSGAVLHVYDSKAKTEVHTDASKLGFGAILMQQCRESEKWHPIYYASAKTSTAEQSWSSYALEAFAVVKALIKFRIYLLDIEFTIITDCQAFVQTMRKKELSVQVAKWAYIIEEFKYKIEHRPGKGMAHVDALSRNPIRECAVVEECESSVTSKMRDAQKDDDAINEIRKNISTRKDYVFRGGLVYRVTENNDICIVVPTKMQRNVILRAHEMGHFGASKTEAILKREYYFKNMHEKIDDVLKNCIACILANKKSGKGEGFLNPIQKGCVPLDTYHIDHVGPMPSTKKAYQHILVVIDAFTKFCWLYPTKTTKSSETISMLEKQATNFGNPRHIVSDRGTSFTSHEFEEYCTAQGIEHTLITTGVPRANGQVERVNRTLKSVITKLAAPNKNDWHKFVSRAQQFINSTVSCTTKATPFRLMFGTDVRLNIDVRIREELEIEWVTRYDECRDEERKKAAKEIEVMQERNKTNFDRKRKPARLYTTGDLVAIKRTQIVPGSKFANNFLGPYRITRAMRHDRYMVEKVGDGEGPGHTTTMAEYMKPWADTTDSTSEPLG